MTLKPYERYVEVLTANYPKYNMKASDLLDIGEGEDIIQFTSF